MNTGAVKLEFDLSGKRGMNTRERLSGCYNGREAANGRRSNDGRKSIMRIDIESMNDGQYESYRELCDSRSAAEFRYRREACGIELSELSDDLGVRLDTVKRWENPRKGMPPSLRAWAYVDSAYLDMMDAVEAAIQDVEDSGMQSVHVAYRRGNMPTRDGETVGRANAVSRAAAIAFSALGYDVKVEWADEGLAGLASQIRSA